jgi:diguanylate cyclase (GGDEF)-like protein/PAS domain S-box-containing protein
MKNDGNQPLPVWLEDAASDLAEKVSDLTTPELTREELTAILNGMQDTVYRTDLEGRFTLISPSVQQVLGYTPGELLGTKLADLYVDPLGREKFLAVFNASQGEVENYEAALWRKDGEVVWVSTNAHYFRDPSGTILGVEGTTRDVTERRRGQQALARTKAQFEAIFNAISDAVIFADRGRRIVLANAGFEALFGYPLAEVVGTSTELLYAHPEDYQTQGGVRYNPTAVTAQPIYELEYRRQDGNTFIGETLGTQVKDAEGRVLGYLGVIRDVTSRRQEQEELNRLKTTLDRTLDCVFMFDPDSLDFFYVNEGATRQVGYTRDELLRMRPFDIKPAHDEASFRELISPLTNGEINSLTFETLHRHKDGHDFPVEIFLQYIAPETEAPRFVAVVRDITERKRADAQMRKLSMALEQTADTIAITDCQGVIEYVNAAFEATTGYHKAEVIGHNASILKSGKHNKAFYKRLWKTILNGKDFRDVFENRRKDGSLYFEEKTITPLKDSYGNIEHFISAGKDISERMEAQQQLQYLAHHDALTGLPNRVLFMDRLDHALARRREAGEKLAVLFLDLDRFKVINDTLGHDVGDQVLQLLAQRVSACIRKGDTLARLSGDEFAIILEEIASDETVAPIARLVLDELALPFEVGNRELFITTSIGISLSPADGEDSQTLLKHADIAMYRAKDLGRNTYQFYSPDMSTKAFERLSLETSLRYALERQQFQLYYQPQVDIRRGKVMGMEALLRWRHPDLGIVSPADFIPILEETGLIVPVGEWVLHTSCAQAAQWREQYGKPLRMSVNLSARQFNDANLMAAVKESLEASGFEPHCLELEITESVIMQDLKWIAHAFKALKEMQVRLAIDDFGTGYSSLSYLKRFPIDTLKIDRTFIRDITTDPDDAAIVKAIIAMARSLKLEIVAEGVETQEQLDFVKARRCGVVQGYLFGEPLPAEAMTTLLEAGLPKN